MIGGKRIIKTIKAKGLTVTSKPFMHLVAQKLIKMPQLIGVCDLPVQRGVPLLRHPRGTADLDGGVAAQTLTGAISLGLGGRPRRMPRGWS